MLAADLVIDASGRAAPQPSHCSARSGQPVPDEITIGVDLSLYNDHLREIPEDAPVDWRGIATHQHHAGTAAAAALCSQWKATSGS